MDRALLALKVAGVEQVSAFVREDHMADRLFERYGFRDIGLQKLDLVLRLTGAPPVME